MPPKKRDLYGLSLGIVSIEFFEEGKVFCFFCVSISFITRSASPFVF